MKDKKKKDSLDKIANDLEQAKVNLQNAIDEEDKKYWARQVKMIGLILERLQALKSKRS